MRSLANISQKKKTELVVSQLIPWASGNAPNVTLDGRILFSETAG